LTKYRVIPLFVPFLSKIRGKDWLKGLGPFLSKIRGKDWLKAEKDWAGAGR